jgi:acyl-CoA thioesterase-1
MSSNIGSQKELGSLALFSHSPAPVTWCFIGDSVTAGIRYTSGARSYVELFHERLREKGRVFDTVINTAVSGWRTTDLAEHLEHIAGRHRPDVVVIGIGLNDAKDGPLKLDGFVQRYVQIISTLRANGAHVVAQTPAGTLQTAPATVVESLQAYSGAIREVAAAADVELVDHEAYWSAVETGLREEWFGRGCHPNEHGHRAMARTLIEAADLWDPETSRVCQACPR